MAVVRTRVFTNSYRDSVELMQIAAAVEAMDGIDRAGLVMATPANRDVLAAAGLLTEAAAAAHPNDLVVTVSAVDEAIAEAALDQAAGRLAGSASEGANEATRTDARTIAEAVAELRDGQPRAHLDTGLVCHGGGAQGPQARLQRLPVQRQRPVRGRDRAQGPGPPKRPPPDGTGLRYRDPRWRAAGVRERGPARDHRPCRRIRHRPPAGELPDPSGGGRRVAGDRGRRPRPGRAGRWRDDARRIAAPRRGSRRRRSSS